MSCFAHRNSVLFSVASYGKSNDAVLFSVLSSLNDVRKTLQLKMKVLVDLVDNITIALPTDLDVSLYIHHPSVKFSLAGEYRYHFSEYLQAHSYDYFMVIENDIRLTHHNLEYLCRTWDFLTDNYVPASNLSASKFKPHILIPILFRFETKSDIDTKKFLAEATMVSGPQIIDVLTVNGKKFLRPAVEYCATWFLPA